MNTEIITIGDEILIGQIIDTNSYWMAQYLSENGFQVNRIASLPDKLTVLEDAFSRVTERADIVFVTGGLGPTKDDVTREFISRFFDTKWSVSSKVLQRIKAFLEERGYSMNDANHAQAEIPENSSVFINQVGTAPGLWLKKGNTHFIFMPGVQFEMLRLLKHQIIPVLKERFIKNVYISKNINTQGIPEAYLSEKLKKWQENLPDCLGVAYLPSPEFVKIRLSGWNNDEKYLNHEIEKAIENVKKIIPDFFVSVGNDPLEKTLGELLVKHHLTVSTAESCTGGFIAHKITSVPGSSGYFKGSIVAYSNEIKTGLLNIEPEILEKHGAVSEETVRKMAEHSLQIHNTDYSIAVSGIAGPSGETLDKPVGTTWIAVGSQRKIFAKKFLLGTVREINIRKAASRALNILRELVVDEYEKK